MKDKLYIDFDGTLYDSNSLYNGFLKICNDYGISDNKIQMAEKTLFNGDYLFDLRILAKYLMKKYKLPVKMLFDVSKLLSNDNLYDDVIEGLKKLEKIRKYEIILLSYGNKKYQKKKIQLSHITKYFDDIIITDKSKLNLENVDYENGVFIENNPYQIDDLYNANSKNVIRIRRNGDKYFYIDTKNSIKEYDDFIQLIEQELL